MKNNTAILKSNPISVCGGCDHSYFTLASTSGVGLKLDTVVSVFTIFLVIVPVTGVSITTSSTYRVMYTFLLC